MKKIIHIVIFSLLAGVLIIGCNDNIVKDKQLNTKPLLSRLNSLNNSIEPAAMESCCDAKDVINIEMADIGGGEVGATIGSIFPGAGTLIGGIIGAAAASWAATGSSLQGSPDSIDTGTGPYAPLPPKWLKFISKMKIPTLPDAGNPYPKVGKRHNELLKQLLLNNYSKQDSIIDISDLFGPIELTGREANFLKAGKERMQKLVEKFLRVKNLDDIKKILSNNTDPVVYKITSKFLEIAPYLSHKDYISYLSKFQSIIMDAKIVSKKGTIFKEKDKEIILKAFSVAWYSGNFWNKLLKSLCITPEQLNSYPCHLL